MKKKKTKVRVIARDSRLSKIQVQEALSHYPEVKGEVKYLPSFGDKRKNISLLTGEAPSDIFTRELDEALLSEKADIAVHSAKDLPYPLPAGLKVIALLAASDTTDSLVSRDHLRLEELPAGSVVGTSSPLRKRELEELRPDLVVKGIRGCIEERIAQVRRGDYDAAIVATCALNRLEMRDEIAEVLPFDTHPLQGYLAITARTDREDLPALFEKFDIMHLQGTVTLVGFGPGDPELLTIKALKAIQRADIIFYDDLTSKGFLQELNAEKVYVGKRSGAHYKEQNEINRLMLQAAREGKQVVRLKGGDPMMFAHAGEEIEYLQRLLIHVEVIPGITTAAAMAADLKVSLTHRDFASSVAFVNGHAAEPITPDADTLVYYMGADQMERISAALIQKGWAENTPVALVHNVSLPDRRVWKTTLGKLSREHNRYPTPLISLVGTVAHLYDHAAEDLKQTLYTGCVNPHPEYVHLPLIRIAPVEDTTELERCAGEMESFNFLLFTSRYGVEQWFRTVDAKQLGRITVVSIGESTSAALKACGVKRFTQVEKDDSYGVIDWFARRRKKGTVLIPRSNLALPIIPEGLEKLGFKVTCVTAYLNLPPENPKMVPLRNIKQIIFTSPSTIDRFVELYGSLPEGITYKTRGQVTQQHLETKQAELRNASLQESTPKPAPKLQPILEVVHSDETPQKDRRRKVVRKKKNAPKAEDPKTVNPKAVASQKENPKAEIPKTETTQAANSSKKAPKKATPKKTTPKEIIPKEVAPKVAASKVVASQKADSKVVASQKADSKVAVPKEPAPKEAAPKEGKKKRTPSKRRTASKKSSTKKDSTSRE
jgi:uroporphyrinogen III methyltransferase/synthase